ncbi:MAG: amino acid ABC transporter permease [Candidatus Bipolaricaulia bacterium]
MEKRLIWLALLVILSLLVLSFPASAQGGLAYKFDWSVLWREPYGRWMLQGITLTLQIGALSWIIALFLGIIIGAIRTLPWKPLRVFGTAYVEFFRNIPLMVQLFFWFYAIPPLISQQLNRWPRLGYYCAIFGLGIYTASRVAEHVRSGLSAVPQGQRFAALSTGLSQLQVYRYVIIPYAIRVMIPPITTEFLTIFKNSSLAMTIGVLEVVGMAYQIGEDTFHGLESTTGAIAIYLIIGLSIIGFMGWVERRLKIPGLIKRG